MDCSAFTATPAIRTLQKSSPNSALENIETVLLYSQAQQPEDITVYFSESRGYSYDDNACSRS